MKKIFLILLFSAMNIFSQGEFTIRSLNPRTLVMTDIFLLSEYDVDSYYKTDLTAIKSLFDDENWVWTGLNYHTGTNVFSSNFVLSNSGATMGTTGEMKLASGGAYMMFRSSVRDDSLVTRRDLLLTANTYRATMTLAGNFVTQSSNASTFGGTVTFNNTFITTSTTTFGGAVSFGASGVFRLGTNTGTLGGQLFRYDLTEDLLAYRYNESGGIDTIPSYRYLRTNYASLSGADFKLASKFVIPENSTDNTLGNLFTKGGDGSAVQVFQYGSGASDEDTTMTERKIRTGNIDVYGQWDFKPQVINLNAGSQTVAVTRNVLNIAGNISPASITNFTGASEGCRLTVVCNKSGSYGFSISDDDTNIELNGDTTLSLGVGDVVEFIRIGSTWFQVAPKSDN